jgi:hypothetical protein
MLCPRCAIGSEGVPGTGAHVAVSVYRVGRLGLLYCQQCGSPISPPNATDSLLEKLAQLAQFGLSAANAPLLASQEPGGKRWRVGTDKA